MERRVPSTAFAAAAAIVELHPAAVVHEDILPGGWVITLSPLIVWMPR
ncbi:MAG: hypothetical protein QNL24_15355 [Akkermansiaceae bacterium]